MTGPSRFHTVVIGAGPAGLLAAWRCDVPPPGLLLVDGGPGIAERVTMRRRQDEREAITHGFGGAGLFSDGKLCLSPRIGSTVSHRFADSEVSRRQNLIDQLLRSGHPAPLRSGDPATVRAVQQAAAAEGMEFLHYPVRHVGTDQLPHLLGRFEERLRAKATIWCQTSCTQITATGRAQAPWALQLRGPHRQVTVEALNVVLAPGKVGAAWLDTAADDLGLLREPAQPKIGFRLEGPRRFLAPLTDAATDPKVIWRGPDGAEARTHCACFGGDVTEASYAGLTLVGGHSTSKQSSDRSNCAVLATAGSREPMTVEQVRALVGRMNDRHGGQVVAQAVGDFLAGRRSAHIDTAHLRFVPSLAGARAGDLCDDFPAPVVAVLRDFLHRLAKVTPRVLDAGNLLYGPAVERWARRYAVNDSMQAPGFEGLYLVGDGPGLTGGIIGAAETGWIAGDAITARANTTAS
jgi:uncharacterized FAD-dependent dehydrogenase